MTEPFRPGVTTLGDLYQRLQGLEIRVTKHLPFMAYDESSQLLGPQHWFPMADYVLVSPEMFEKLKQLPEADQ